MPEDGRRGWERWLLPLLLVLAGVLLLDRLRPLQPPLLERRLWSFAFPLALLLGVAQNLHALVARGVRATDIPIVLYNVGVGVCATAAAAAVQGAQAAPVLLYDYSVLQHLAGSHLAHFSTLSWHLPIFVRRGRPTSLPAAMAGLIAPAFCGFAVLMLVLFRSESEAVLKAFEHEARSAAPRAGLALGVLQLPEGGAPPPGTHEAWMLPADHDGEGLPPRARPLVLELCAPESWAWRRPDRAAAVEVFLAGAERLSARLQPELLLPWPEPDGVAPLLFGAGLTPDDWRELYSQARRRVAAVSPGTRLAARLSGLDDDSHAIMLSLSAPPGVVDVLGPRLHPGSARAGGPALADEVLRTWGRWRAELPPSPPSLWVLAAGLSPLAYGEDAQARFIEGCVARASADPQIEGLLIEGWRDRGHTLGLLRPDGSARGAALVLRRLTGGR